MKEFISIWVFFFFKLNVFAQHTWTQKINDTFYHNTLSKGLQIGDKMPDLLFGNVVNNVTGAAKFSDLKGKLIILDFWASYCASCLEGFPEMERLQKEFSDKIQIILVNPFETFQTVRYRRPSFRFPNLPSIMKDKLGHSERLLQLLPIRSLGHQVWIDAKGIIRLRGGHQNTTQKKILDFLNGEDVFILNDNSMVPQFDENVLYTSLLGGFTETPIRMGSVITAFNNEYDAETQGKLMYFKDSLTNTVRNTFVNVKILDFYRWVYQDILLKSKRKIFFGPTPGSMSGYTGFHCITIPKDTLRYTTDFYRGIRNDSVYMKPRICYEQILPMNTSIEEQNSAMAEDVGKYLKTIYGAQIKLVKKIIPCYVLVRTSNSDKIGTRANGYNVDFVRMKEEQPIKYQNVSMSIFGDIIESNENLTLQFWNNSKTGKPIFFVNETGFKYNKRIDLEIPSSENIKSMEDFRKVLLKYDLDIRVESMTFDFLDISDNSDEY